ncbi:MAG: large-conductance mechanosensitive channel protein MscL [Planctomycetales bacterium]|nr:large-conductance mechanosensitive channel protein MscL [Planctomycetales bacterium]
MGLIQEFKDFAMKGNVVDMAVGVVIGGAFGKIVTSLVNNIITPLTGILTGGISLEKFTTLIGTREVDGETVDNYLLWGSFLQSIVDFLIVAFAIFIAIKIMNRVREQFESPEEETAPAAPPEDIQLLREIRDALKKG